MAQKFTEKNKIELLVLNSIFENSHSHEHLGELVCSRIEELEKNQNVR